MARELTGRDVLLIAVGAFGVIIAVNLALAWAAVKTFPGIEVRNGYVASQSFEAERQAQRTLGWRTETRLDSGLLTVTITDADGYPAEVAAIEALMGRATTTADDLTPVFERRADGRFQAPVAVTRGQWVLHLRATAADGTVFRQRVSVPVRE